jgi:GTPase KRas protein
VLEDSYGKQCLIDDEVALLDVLDVLDTAGQEEYRYAFFAMRISSGVLTNLLRIYSAMREKYVQTGEGFLLVYSITSRNSFEEINTFYQQILRVKDQDSVPVIIVANKCDLEYERQVGANGMSMVSQLSQANDSFPEGRDLAKHFGCKFIETSAKVKLNVDESFYGLVREIRRHNKVGFTDVM